MREQKRLTILGGGPAGLSVGYFARKRDLGFTIYEANSRVGGNCVTFRCGDFLFDSGAHRLHCKDLAVIQEMKKLLGDDLQEINVPSQIYYDGKLVDFPLSPLNLLKHLGVKIFLKAIVKLIKARLKGPGERKDLESFAQYAYGDIIAGLFLLNYSSKLWGISCQKLSRNVAGGRMKGLNLKTFLTEALRGRKEKTRHLDGAFYYPKMGIGMISDKMAEACGVENLVKDARVTRVFHQDRQVKAVEINGNSVIEVDELVSTLPLGLFLEIMDPKPPSEILDLARNLRFRNLILVYFLLDKDSVTESATIYFPDPEFIFTRVYESKKRSPLMAPPGKTSLVAEIPCYAQDALWNEDKDQLIERVYSQFHQIGWINKDEILRSGILRIPHAYPVLDLGFEERVSSVLEHLGHFSNLHLVGRNGRFMYSSIHHMIKSGKELIERLPLFDKDLMGVLS